MFALAIDNEISSQFVPVLGVTYCAVLATRAYLYSPWNTEESFPHYICRLYIYKIAQIQVFGPYYYSAY